MSYWQLCRKQPEPSSNLLQCTIPSTSSPGTMARYTQIVFQFPCLSPFGVNIFCVPLPRSSAVLTEGDAQRWCMIFVGQLDHEGMLSRFGHYPEWFFHPWLDFRGGQSLGETADERSSRCNLLCQPPQRKSERRTRTSCTGPRPLPTCITALLPTLHAQNRGGAPWRFYKACFASGGKQKWLAIGGTRQRSPTLRHAAVAGW
jgi:hypothetical protein